MLAFISDVHIRKSNDESALAFLRFLDHPLVLQSDKIYLLGDIFDLMVGEKVQYLEKYPIVFKKLHTLAKSGKKLIFVEGNHDFHLKKLFENYFPEGSYSHHFQPIVETYNGQNFLICHGDEIEIDNPSYENYRNFIKSGPIRFLANNIVPHAIIQAIGDRASRTSRKYSANYENDVIKEKFRKSAELACQKYNVKKIICGHSHILDNFESDELKYFNNGYFPKTLSFTMMDETGTRLEKL